MFEIIMIAIIVGMIIFDWNFLESTLIVLSISLIVYISSGTVTESDSSQAVISISVEEPAYSAPVVVEPTEYEAVNDNGDSVETLLLEEEIDQLQRENLALKSRLSVFENQ